MNNLTSLKKLIFNTSGLLLSLLLLNVDLAAAAVANGNIEGRHTVFQIGNNDIGAKFHTKSFSNFDHQPLSQVQKMSSYIDLNANLMKMPIQIFQTYSFAGKYMNRGRPSFENRGHVKIMGITIASQSPSYKDGYKRGDTGALSIQKTFTCQAAKYQVSIVTLAVNGCAKGGLSTSSAGKNATALDYHGKTFTRLGAFVRADSSISAGIPILATAGVTASVDLMDANMVTTAQGWGTSSSDSSSIKYSGNVNSEANADVGGGTVSLWVKLLEQPVVQEVLASWSGYRLAHQELFNKDYSKVVEL